MNKHNVAIGWTMFIEHGSSYGTIHVFFLWLKSGKWHVMCMVNHMAPAMPSSCVLILPGKCHVMFMVHQMGCTWSITWHRPFLLLASWVSRASGMESHSNGHASSCVESVKWNVMNMVHHMAPVMSSSCVLGRTKADDDPNA